MNIVGSLVGVGVLVAVLMAVGFVFSFWMFLDALKRRDMVWIVLFALSFGAGFLAGSIPTLYYYMVYKKNKKHVPESYSSAIEGQEDRLSMQSDYPHY